MKKFIAYFVFDVGEPERAEEVNAADYTKAYLYITFKYDHPIITELKEI